MQEAKHLEAIYGVSGTLSAWSLSAAHFLLWEFERGRCRMDRRILFLAKITLAPFAGSSFPPERISARAGAADGA